MAPSKKRKRESVDDDDATYGLRQTLPVANLPIDFDGEPLDGLQYLFLVRRDARRLPGVKHVTNPYAFVPPQPTQPTCRTKAAPLLPCNEWRSKFERHFHNFRGNMSQPVAIRPQPPGPFQRMIPEKKNRDAWWAFLEGAPESIWNPPKTAGRGKERVGQCGVATQQLSDTSSDIAIRKPRELSPTLLFQVDHRFSLHLVMYFTHWFNLYLESLDSNSNGATTYAPTDVHMRWVFALLTRVDLFCSADETGSLRGLARTCLALISAVRRAKIGSNPPPSAPCEREDGETTETGAGTTEAETNANVNSSSSPRDPKTLSECSMWFVFCAVTNIWGQRDLWDEAEQALSQPL